MRATSAVKLSNQRLVPISALCISVYTYGVVVIIGSVLGSKCHQWLLEKVSIFTNKHVDLLLTQLEQIFTY
jgi:hypothetical protein